MNDSWPSRISLGLGNSTLNFLLPTLYWPLANGGNVLNSQPCSVLEATRESFVSLKIRGRNRYELDLWVAKRYHCIGGFFMSQPVKLSDELVDDARAVVPFSQRSIAGQIEFWAGLGKSIEPLLRGDRALSLQMAGGDRPLSELLAELETRKGRKRLEAVLKERPYPHFKPVVGHPELICRIEENGSETIGRFVGREFIAVEVPR